MQDIDHSVKVQHLDFSKGNLTMPMVLSRIIDAEILRGYDQRYSSDTPLTDIVQQEAQIDSLYRSQYCYLPESNVLIYAGNKAGSSSVREMLNKLEHVTGEERIINLNSWDLLNLIESRDPEIWYIYRDPVSRFISFFYYIGRQAFHRHGVRWDWRGADMFNGVDFHRLPQFMFLPVYINNPQIHERIRDIVNSNRITPISQEWAYDMLKDFIPDNKVKFFWLHEDGTPNKWRRWPPPPNRRNPIEIMYDKLGIAMPSSASARVNINSYRPKWDDIPREFKQKIWDATILEREFLSKIRWQNGPISFHGLS